MAKRPNFVGTPSLAIHGKSFSGTECLGALALTPLHPWMVVAIILPYWLPGEIIDAMMECLELPSMAKRPNFVGTPSLVIHGESFSGTECLGALVLHPLHPYGAPHKLGVKI
ncbi:MAG: hypothetical protein DHS20C11_14640 [Lysobacteraceae bacterium]|nr:MAG: hypothetical protein DHS20C11_14640 [Xanthomonadaceae bacterium]